MNWGKGEAVLWIKKRLARTLRPRPALTVYTGDDITDEAAFAALEGHGVTVRVGAHRGRADYAVKNVKAVHALLRWLARGLSRFPPTRRIAPLTAFGTFPRLRL